MKGFDKFRNEKRASLRDHKVMQYRRFFEKIYKAHVEGDKT